MTKKIFVTSLKGGTGVTTCAVNLGVALSRLGEKTLIFDGDMNCASALSMAMLDDKFIYTLADVERGACRAKQAIVKHEKFSSLYFLPSLNCFNEKFAVKALLEVAELFDYVICDGVAMGACERALVVSDTYATSLKSADRCISILKDGGIGDVSLLLNKVNGGLVYDGLALSASATAELLRAPLAGVIPEDLSLPFGRIKRQTEKAFLMTAENLTGKNDKIYAVVEPYIGVNGYFKRKMRCRI